MADLDARTAARPAMNGEATVAVAVAVAAVVGRGAVGRGEDQASSAWTSSMRLASAAGLSSR